MDGPGEQLLGGGVEVDDAAGAVKGHHTVGHVEEKGVQLIAFVFHSGNGVLELLGHSVEALGEQADLVPAGHFNFLGEIAVGHLFQPVGETLDGGGQSLGQQGG